MLRSAEIVGAEMAASREGAEVFSLPPGIASEEVFFDAAKVAFPLSPPLDRETNDWEALRASLARGIADRRATVVLVWADPWLLEEFDPDAARLAVQLLSGLATDLADVTTLLGTRGV
jgi:hypothetical protein